MRSRGRPARATVIAPSGAGRLVGSGDLASEPPLSTIATDPVLYRKRIRAWVLYDWANSAFATTILAAVLPVYFSTVAGATLPSAARATQVFSLTTSIALGVTAVLSPLLGAYSDLAAAKKRLLALFVAIGATATAALVLVGEGDWLLAAGLFALGRIGFGAANVLYDALLPHVARPEDQDRVSAQGFAVGYAGGGLLLAVNVAMILTLPDDGLGARLSFLSVAIWWIAFSIPIFRRVPEPPPTRPADGTGATSLGATVRQVRAMLRDLRRFRDLARFLVAFLIYNDAINVVIGVAALYGAELGFGSTELLLAILLVQFTGVPYSLMFGRLPVGAGRRHERVTAFLVLNIVLLPLVALGGRFLLPGDLVGRAPAPPPATAEAAGLGEVTMDASFVSGPGSELVTIDGGYFGRGSDVVGRTASAGEPISLQYAGQDVIVEYVAGPDHGVIEVRLDGAPLLDGDEPVTIDASGPTVRYGETERLAVPTVGEHTLTLVSRGGGADGGGAGLTITRFEVMEPSRAASLPGVLGILIALQLVIGAVVLVVAPLFRGLAARLDTKRSIQLALVAYTIVAVWGFALDTVVEFWALAWLVSVVQGGSQALSRSMYASLVPDVRSGEFFGLFSILSKFASFLSPLIFVASVAMFESSRPAVLVLGGLFLTGILLLRRVDPVAGRAAAEAEDARVRAG